MRVWSLLLEIKIHWVCITIIVFSCNDIKDTSTSEHKTDTVNVYVPRIAYGFLLDTFTVFEDTIKPGMTLSHLLAPHGISQQDINKAAMLAADSAFLKFVTDGKPYMILSSIRDTSKKAQYCIYDKSKTEYVIFDFTQDVKVSRVQRPVTTNIKKISGIIVKNSNLVNTLKKSVNDENLAGELAEAIASIYAWTIDFFKLYPDDYFKIIYEEKSVEGTPFGIGKIYAVFFYNINQGYYAFRFEQDGEYAYYDEQAKGMRRAFLKAPLKFSRISSGYNLKRFHPVDKVWRAHLGTDYAAPAGTPIMAVGDGVIEAATFSQYNGNYVKIKHSNTYQTAYLHMSKFASGIRAGVKVKQGEVIGYVGSTGLATGPHVCFRFWKNGRQIDHLKEKFLSSDPVKNQNLNDFFKLRDSIKPMLDSFKHL
jgi:murein DD-endopeptidase MepM/ murein hydrolase activator NlpD